MARVAPNQRLVSSVFDRLLGRDAETLPKLREAVRRDLENLLNTRVRALGFPEEYAELADSLVNYGIPDFSRARLGTEEDQKRFLKRIEEAVRIFEPRLRKVQADLLTPADRSNRQLSFRIKAELLCEPAPLDVEYDSSLQSATGTFQVKEKR